MSFDAFPRGRPRGRWPTIVRRAGFAAGLIACLAAGAGACAKKDDGLPPSTPSLRPGTVGQPYSELLVPTAIPSLAGKGPFAFSVVGGALPLGLALGQNTGEVAGTPTAQGISTFTARLVDGAQTARDFTFSIDIQPAP
ncbi:MAG: hypothetical protein HY719_09965 [Planctomycetes bacterium]|nr:hypothetical protein [Planctomycetota bacterium]